VKPLVVRDQVRIGAGRCLGLTLAGMSYRLFRSLVTVSILALAVAFLAHVLAYSLVEHRTRVAAYRELKESRLLGEWTTRLTAPDPVSMILARLSGGDSPRLAEYRTWSGATAEEFEAARRAAASFRDLHDWLEALPVAARAVLMADLEATEFVARLSEPERLETFLGHLEQLKLEPPLGGAEALERFLQEDRPRALAMAERIRRGHAEAIRRMRAAYPDRSVRSWFADAPPDLAATLSDAGYRLPEGGLPKLAELARQAEDLIHLNEAVKVPQTVRDLARELRIRPTEVTPGHVLEWLDSPERAEKLAGLLEDRPGAAELRAEELMTLAGTFHRQDKLQAAVGDEPPAMEVQGFLAVPSWTRWLIAVSFLVCTVGVANAMFMSVTERFAEIATMKCLGAMDGFIRVMFLFESGIQGILGAVAGIVLGYALAGVRAAGIYGDLLVVPGRELLVGAGACVGAGLVLAVLAAVGPASAASRLAPMEAMRIE
jgi:hypothetical protein